VRACAKLVWNVNLIRQVWLEDVFGVGFDLVKKVIIGGTKQVLDGWLLAASHGLRVQTRK